MICSGLLKFLLALVGFGYARHNDRPGDASHLCSEWFPGRALPGPFSDRNCLHPGGEIFGGVLGGCSCLRLNINRVDSHCFLQYFFTSTWEKKERNIDLEYNTEQKNQG